jgi:amino acid transporter
MVFYGLALGSVGGPLALAVLYMPQTVSGVRSSAGSVVLLAIAAFTLPIVVWRRYAGEISSSGGLYAFVEAAAGTRVARVQGTVWAVSYFLYMPYTVAFVVYDLLPVAFPRIDPYRAPLELGIPLAMVAAVLLWRSEVFALIAGAAVLQVALVVALAIVQGVHAGLRPSAFAPRGATSGELSASAAVSLLFVCASLALFFGGELTDPRRLMRRALPLALGVGGACALAVAVTLGRVPGALLDGSLPGWSVAYAFGGPGFASLIAAGTAVSILTLVLLEYVALARLLHAMLHQPVRRMEGAAGAAFLVMAVISLLGPQAFYARLAPPSLVALFVSQLFVFGVYPAFRRRRGALRPSDVMLTVGASGLMLYGLVTAVTSQVGS